MYAGNQTRDLSNRYWCLLLICFKEFIDEIFDALRRDLGSIPGRLSFSKDESLFKSFLTPSLKQQLTKRGLPTRLDGSLKTCGQSDTCRILFKKSMAFSKTFKTIFPLDIRSKDFLSERPGPSATQVQELSI